MATAPTEKEPPLAGLFQSKRDPNEPTKFGRIYIPDNGWLSKALAEPILEPQIPIIDTHHHLWDLPGYRYLLRDFIADTETGHSIVGTVFNECQAMYRATGPKEMQPVGEVEFCAGVGAMSESGIYGKTRVCAGIVGFADLTLGDAVTPVLEAEMAAGGGRFKGVRYAAAWDTSSVIGNSHTSPAPGVYGSDRFRAGMSRLVALGLSLDAWVFHPQLQDVIALARAFPDANIVMCHLGGPLGYGPYAGKQAEVFSQWKLLMAELAKCPNVSVKLGGVTMRLAAFDYMKLKRPPNSEELANYWKPYVTTCIDFFGADRCMFESNFPVEKMGIGYAGLWNGFKRMVSSASTDEKKELFSGTASRVYRLDV